MRAFALGCLTSTLLCAACTESLQQTCPANSSTVGGFNLTFTTFDDAGDFCHVVRDLDGGAMDGSVTTGPTSVQATLCSSPDDGGYIALAIPGQTTRTSSVDSSGHFNFPTNALQVTGTQCNCAIDIAETLSGQLQPIGDGGALVIDLDGGLSTVGGFSAALVDQVTISPDAGDLTLGPDAGSLYCRCNLPCALRYGVSGSRL